MPSNITYLYVRRKFAWDEPEYATFAAVISSVAGFGTAARPTTRWSRTLSTLT